MTFSKFAQKIYFYLLVASLYLTRSKSKIFIHSFIHFMPALMLSSSEQNITRSCIFESNYFFWR